ncbi:hypothetical protein CAC42_1177 [Sphaceloma murrayae]|uniref:Uncharacterized protein n=1 Tax=Sphaceloma murrayae TaxID=2082308 RepID=A0A2K1R270_9PEZI|nr:hypothetical protein CAC42_1177 [Sphaceloma murrayae]
MVFCTYCGHSFTRDEHLERHILTHTNVKPFKCFTCHMSFARRDLLQRHYTVHGRNQDQQEVPATNGMIPKSAGRTPIACSNCAKTKTKCDKKFPCSRCASRNLRCTLRPTRRSTKNAARMGLITPETIAQDIANGILPPDQTVAAEKVPLPIAPQGPCDDAERSPSLVQESSKSSSCTGSPASTDQACTAFDAPPPPPFDRSSGGSTPPGTRGLSPTTPLSGQGFNGSSGFPGFDHVGQQADKTPSEDCNPHFMLDWQQLQLPSGLDPMLQGDMLDEQELNFDLGAMGIDVQVDPALSINPDMTTIAPPHLVTPIDTPRRDQERNFSIFSNYTLDSQYQSLATTVDPVIVAQDGWNVFRCIPPVHPNACPATARWNLEALESSLKDHDTWSKWRPQLDEPSQDPSQVLTVMQLHESSRDKLLAITQGFLHKALEIHRGTDQRNYAPSNFVLLPPTRVLEYLLRSYTTSFERYYPLTTKGSLDANELMFCYQDRASSLLILLMIAKGAMNIAGTEARALTGGLLETCRISLYDLIERNIVMACDHNVLHAALIFTELASWSGDKWQMDIAMGQRGMYTAMLKHSGVLDRTVITTPSMLTEDQANNEHLWNLWIQQESRSRLVYSWAMVDQELALFHDTNPLFSVTEFGIAMPHDDRVWQTKTASEWAQTILSKQDSPDGPGQNTATSPSCLRELFRRFLDDEMDSVEYALTPMHIRLLLLPLQSMVSHYSQLMSCFSDSGSSRAKHKTVTASSTRCRLEEVQCLLQRWFDLANTYLQAHPMDHIMQAALVLYHLISLNAVIDFPQIERLARRETFDGTYQTLVWTHKRCITDVGEALFHCGQIIRLIRSMPRSEQPAWWAAAIYRVTLVAWCDSLIDNSGKGGQGFAIDNLPADHPTLQRYLNKGEGVPRLSRRDGTTVGLDHGLTVLNHFIEVIDEGLLNRFQEGIRGKLDQLMKT